MFSIVNPVFQAPVSTDLFLLDRVPFYLGVRHSNEGISRERTHHLPRSRNARRKSPSCRSRLEPEPLPAELLQESRHNPFASAIRLCDRHHRFGNDSYHKLGRRFVHFHGLDIPAIIRKLDEKPRLNAKPANGLPISGRTVTRSARRRTVLIARYASWHSSSTSGRAT